MKNFEQGAFIVLNLCEMQKIYITIKRLSLDDDDHRMNFFMKWLTDGIALNCTSLKRQVTSFSTVVTLFEKDSPSHRRVKKFMLVFLWKVIALVQEIFYLPLSLRNRYQIQ